MHNANAVKAKYIATNVIWFMGIATPCNAAYNQG